MNKALTEGVVYLAPFLVLIAFLAAGFYPSERLVTTLAARPRRRRRRLEPSLLPLPRLSARRPRGGRLLATALAGRAPPPRWS